MRTSDDAGVQLRKCRSFSSNLERERDKSVVAWKGFVARRCESVEEPTGRECAHSYCAPPASR